MTEAAVHANSRGAGMGRAVPVAGVAQRTLQPSQMGLRSGARLQVCMN
jgi:hypothetical protein